MKVNTTPYPVSLEIVDSWEIFRDKYYKYKGHYPEKCSLGTTAYHGNGNRFLVGIFDGSITTLIHELNHFCISTMGYIGLDINGNTSEAYCYYFDSIFNQVIGKMGIK